ncbi:MAG TPA: glycoside hydrolase family 6 protein [Longimicrobiaceae bacterium]|nr:glycoside hydrolase family 6 protein [Longimicrobiaceae bacterium]
MNLFRSSAVRGAHRWFRPLEALLLGALALAGTATPAAALSGDDETPADANPVARARFYVHPVSHARQQADAWRRSRPQDAALMEWMASQPTAHWVGDWSGDPRADVDRVVSAAARTGATPVLVAYNIPQRDCGLHSAGGARGADAYRRWIRGFAAGIARRRVVVILEPDAVMVMDCLSPARREERLELLRDAVGILKGAGATVYLDAGNGRWGRPDEMASRLQRAGVAGADGFALNVSNFIATHVNIAYGEQISRRTGGKHFVIDTSRNGAGTATGREWCNVAGQALGTAPTTRTGHRLVDAFLWVKRPGESDGTCNGGPAAGRWWADYALGLARRASSAGTLASR